MFPLFETIRLEDGKLYHSELHQQRYEKSYYAYYKKISQIDIISKISIDEKYQKGLFKVKISYNETALHIEFKPYKIQEIKTLKIIKNNDINYSLKYSNRNAINNLYSMRANYDDILIIKNDLVTDTSYCNIVFFDGKRWITPLSPLLQGVARQHLLNIGTIEAANIHEEDIKTFTHFKLINAMRDFSTINSIDIKNIQSDKLYTL